MTELEKDIAARYNGRLVRQAVASFAGTGPSDGIFNTAGYQHAFWREFGEMPGGTATERLLRRSPDIVQLSGGCHWMLLPDGHERHVGKAWNAWNA